MSAADRTVDALARLGRFGMRPGLDGMRAALAALGNPERAWPSVHVAGTNGKGTTAACLAAVSTAHGLRTGLTTSPHLLDVRERVRIDGAPVDADAFADAWERLRPLAERRDLTYFEATTAMAFDLFARAGVDLAVVETGLGGRLDATNVVDPLVAVVTNVALDHELHLGHEPAAIAREKAGIFKPGRPALVGDPGPPEARRVWEERARDVEAPLVLLPEVARWRVREIDRHGTRFDYASDGARLDGLTIATAGEAFVEDAALALRAWEIVAPALGRRLDEDTARRALAEAPLSGRMERAIVNGVPHLLDVAHNPAAVGRLATTLAALGDVPAAFVVGILADKAWTQMLDAFEPVARHAWLCELATAEPGRRLDRGAAARGVGARPWVTWAAGVPEGLARARAVVAEGSAREVVVTGSFRTVAEALVALELGSPDVPYTARRVAGAVA